MVNAHEHIEVFVLWGRDNSTVQHVKDVHKTESLEDHRVVLVLLGICSVSEVIVDHVVFNIVEHGSEIQKSHTYKGLVDSLEPDGSSHHGLHHIFVLLVLLDLGELSWVRGFGGKSCSSKDVHN